MEILDGLRAFTYWNNTGYDYLVALAIFVGGVIILKVVQVVIISRLHQLARMTKNDFDDVVIAIFRNIKPPFYFLISLHFFLSF